MQLIDLEQSGEIQENATYSWLAYILWQQTEVCTKLLNKKL